MSDKIDGWDAFKYAFEYTDDKTAGFLKTQSAGAASGSSGTDLPATEVLEQVFDPDTNQIRIVFV